MLPSPSSKFRISRTKIFSFTQVDIDWPYSSKVGRELSRPGSTKHTLKARSMQKVTPFLWFDGNAEEAMKFYTSIFKRSKITEIRRYGDGSNGGVVSGTFQIDGQNFMALNGGPHFSFSPAVSFFVNCETQEEVDDLWEKLSAGGEKLRCGWLKDKFGLTWQIIPAQLGEMLNDKDPVKAKNVMDAMLKMDKIDIKMLRQAYGK